MAVILVGAITPALTPPWLVAPAIDHRSFGGNRKVGTWTSVPCRRLALCWH